MPTLSPLDVMRAAGIQPDNVEEFEELMRILERLDRDPQAVAVELINARRSCRQAVKAAEDMEGLLKGLVSGQATLWRFESLREEPDGTTRAICRLGAQLRTAAVHPDVSVSELEGLQPWEFVLVNEGVIVGLWKDDPCLLAMALGDVVTFKGVVSEDDFQVRVGRDGQGEAVVTLAAPLRLEELTPEMRLVLHRDDPRWAIAAIPAQRSESPFEERLDGLVARLDDLAGLDGVAETLMKDVLLRIVFPQLRERFDLDPMRGVLLSSHKPGQGKTALVRAFACWLRDLGRRVGFDTLLYIVKPNQTKSMWWGEDARIVREDLWGAIRARQALGRERALFQLVVFDEIDSLQKRSGPQHGVTSSSHSDALEALLVELDGLVQQNDGEGPPAHVLCIGMTNRPDRLDDAAKRPGRFGDLVLEMPDITAETAEDILAIYARKADLPWQVHGEIRDGLPAEEIKAHFLRPAVARVFPAVVLRYATDMQRTIDVTAGQLLAGVHYRKAMNEAKKRAALRELENVGPPAITCEDVLECLADAAVDVAQQMAADRGMLIEQLRIKVPVARVDAVPVEQLKEHRFLKLHSA